MKRLALMGWLMLLVAAGACSDDDRNTSCLQDTDCRKIDDCCAGCLAVNVSEVIESCDSECVASACTSTNQEAHVAVCRSKECTLVPLMN